MQILLGNALDILPTLPQNSFDCCFTGPNPVFYKIGHPDPNMIGAQTDTHQYVQTLVNIFEHVKTCLKPQGSLFCQMGDSYDQKTGGLRLTPMLFALSMQKNGWIMAGNLVWHRTENKNIKRGPENGFVKDWEYLFHFVLSKDYYFNPNSNKFWKTSVISAPLGDGFFTNEFDSGFPERLIEIALKTCTPEKGTVLDPMAGSGKTGEIAKKMGRDFTLIELQKEIYDLLCIKFGLI